jgi:hypothetical protein
MKLSVGKVVYVLDKKTHSVVPCQVVEIISSVTLEGEAVKNIVTSPTGKKIVLEDYNATWFENYEKAYEYLKEAALELVSHTMRRAGEVAFASFGVKPVDLETNDEKSPDQSLGLEAHTLVIDPETKNDLEPEQVFVDIGGQQVKVTLPRELSHE